MVFNGFKLQFMMEWTDAATSKLIQEFEMRAHLYDPQLPDYHNKHLKNQGWRELAEMFKTTGLYVCYYQYLLH